MPENKKVYSIEINGIRESIDAVNSLNNSLTQLETRIDALKSKASVNVGVNVNETTSSSKSSELKEQDSLEKQILATEEKLSQVRSENYKKLLHMKEELKEYTQIAKSNVAATENAQGVYDTNTMLGMKSTLKNIKQEMQTLDVSSDRFRELTIQANELNEKLKSIEQSYGQFGRNVGNYANGVAEGLQKVVIKVGDTERTFESAKKASRELGNELKTMAANGQQGTEEFKNLQNAVAQLKSDMDDAMVSSKAMDELLDTMKGFASIGQISQGFSAFFGLDSNEIERSIQKLVALQNVMQGLEALNQQLMSGEGIGGWLMKGNAAIDSFVNNLFGVEKASKAATIATKAFGTALKAVGIGLIIAGITELVHWLEVWSDKQKKAAEEAEEAAEKVRKSIEEQRQAYVSASVQYQNTASRLSHLRTEYMKTNDQLKKTSILKEATEQFKKLGISVNGVSDAQRILVKDGDKVIELLRLQGDAAGIAAIRMDAYRKSFNMLMENGYDANAASILASSNQTVRDLDKRLDSVNTQISKLQKNLNINTEKIKKTAKDAKKTTFDLEKELTEVKIEAMRDGLNKTIAQLEEEKRQRINKIKSNGVAIAELTKATEALYQRKIEDARREFAKKFEDAERQMWKEIGRIGSDAASLASENILKASENRLDRGIDRLQTKLKKIYVDYAPNYDNVSDANRSKAGNFEAQVRQGELYAPDGTKINEDTLNALKAYQDILEAIDATEGRIYMLQRSKQENGDTKLYDEEALGAAEDAIKSLREELEKLIKIQNEGKNIDYEAGFNALYGGDIEEFKRQLAAKIQAEKDAANESYKIEEKRIKDEAQLREDQYAKEKYEELNGLESQKKYELKVLENQLKLEEISISKYREETANTEAKYAQLAMDTEIKYGVEIEGFTEKLHKQLKELEERHKQELLDIDKRYEGDADKQRKAAFDKYVDDLNKYYAEIAQKIEDANAEIAELEASREEIQSNPIGVSRDEIADEIIENYKKDLEVLKREKEAFLEYIGYTEEEVERSLELDALRNENYTSNLSEQFDARLGNHIKYYDDVEKAEKKHWDIVLKEQKWAISAQTEGEKTAAEERLSGLTESLNKQEELELNSVKTEKERNDIREKFRKQREAAEKTTQDHIKQLDEQYKNDIERAEIEHQNNIKATVTKTQQSIIGEYRDFYSKLSNVQASLPITNSWGIINLKETKKRNKELIESYTSLGQSIVSQKNELQKKLDDNEITFDDFRQARRELNDLQTSVASALENVERDSKELFGKFLGTINEWVQAVGQTMNQIIGSLAEIQANQYERMINEQEKYIDKYKEMLQKQQDITQEHASEVDAIEDELSNARGARRQQLIDMLNAEMAAQRASLAQEKKIEKEREKAEEKKKKLEHDAAEAKKRMQLAQAAINMAMAISMAAVNTWPIPAIPMMALAAAAGAAQIAAIKSQNIPSYGSGGVIQGKSHKEGGVKVLGGQAEVEGGEFITNRVTTSKNVDLLNYINGKRRRIKLEDLIDFYGGNSQVKKNIQGVRTKFADGGIIPTLRNDINLSDRMLTAFEDYSNRPVQVAVVDIIDKSQQVNNVRVMAGLDN